MLVRRIYRRVASEITELRLRRGLPKVNERITQYSASITLAGDFCPDRCKLGHAISCALYFALYNIHALPNPILELEGMSGVRYREFINRLIGHLPDPRYLEIGSWKGSTVCAALYGNQAKALCIDNWAQYGGPRAEFFSNLSLVQMPTVIESDFRHVDYASVGSFNVMFFDGPHSETDQYDGVRLTQPALDNEHVLIVDDWNWRSVRIGTLRGIRDSSLNILSIIEIRTTLDNSHPTVSGKHSAWHNGTMIAVLQKSKGASI